MKFHATLVLVLGVLVPYYALSNGTLYLTDSTLANLGFTSGSGPANFITHLFTHVGLTHLLSNLVPLAAFGLLLESAVASRHVLGVFFASGVLSTVLFSFLNPQALLVGASTGVSGLMAASTLLKPKKALVLLFAMLVLIASFAPLVSYYNSARLSQWQEEGAVLGEKIKALEAENRMDEAEAQSETLSGVRAKITQTSEGVAREKETPTDLLVHLFGAVFGAAYVILFARKSLERGVAEFESLGRAIRSRAFAALGFFKPGRKNKT